jgi:oligopeptide transport system permease protein
MEQSADIILSPDAFNPVEIDSEAGEAIVRPSISFWQDVMRRLLKNKVAMFGLACILTVLIFSIVAPLLSPYEYSNTDYANINSLPSAEHWFGTDTLGRDLWTRVWVGARISLLVGIFGAIVPSIIGIAIGGISGYFGGKLDMVIMRIVDICSCIPELIYVILIMIYLGSGPVPIIIAFAITGWMGSARNVRGLVLQLREQEFVLASRTLGASPARLIFKHLIPNTLGIVVVSITMAIPGAIFYEAYLSFIGLGVQAPMTSWGQLANAGVSVFRVFPNQLFIPAAFICVTMLSFNLFGDGLRDALDPKLRN